jgi:rod shape-determining protein MreC
VPRHRTARSPLTRSSAPRAERSRGRDRGASRARLVAFALVLVSLALVTVYFRESSEDGALHGAQKIGVSALAPFEIAAERVARPFQDAYGWSRDVLSAKDENKDLRKEVSELRNSVIANENAVEENKELRKLLGYRDSERFPDDYRGVATRVFVRPQTVFRQDVLVAAGSNDGIRPEDPVSRPEGLVGTVTEVTPNTSKVRLLTDAQSAASAFVLGTGASGVVLRGVSSDSSDSLILDRVAKDERVEIGDIVVTAGSSVGGFESLYPRGIPICRVTSVSQRDIDTFKTIQCTPLVDFSSLHDVIVLVPKGRS